VQFDGTTLLVVSSHMQLQAERRLPDTDQLLDPEFRIGLPSAKLYELTLSWFVEVRVS
jgi:hypothetical protein